jgi:hypothetical protein
MMRLPSFWTGWHHPILGKAAKECISPDRYQPDRFPRWRDVEPCSLCRFADCRLSRFQFRSPALLDFIHIQLAHPASRNIGHASGNVGFQAG